VSRGIRRSIFLCVSVKYRLSVSYGSLDLNPYLVQSIRCVSKIVPPLSVTFLLYLAWCIKRTLSLSGPQLIPIHPSIHYLPPSGLFSIGSVPSTFFIEYSAPIPRSHTTQPPSYSIARCKCSCMSFYLEIVAPETTKRGLKLNNDVALGMQLHASERTAM